MKCINCTKFIQCSLDHNSKEGNHECRYFIERDEEIEHRVWVENIVKEMLEG